MSSNFQSLGSSSEKPSNASKSFQKPDQESQGLPSQKPGILPSHLLAQCMGIEAGVYFPWK